jgi:hypothetical protein
VNLSLNETLMRSVNTSLVVLLPIASLLLFGGSTLKDFAFALLVGVASGAYSSIFLASPMLALLKEREPQYLRIRERAAGRAARPALRGVPAPALAEGDGEVQAPAAVRPPRRTTGTGGGKSRKKSAAKRRRR